MNKLDGDLKPRKKPTAKLPMNGRNAINPISHEVADRTKPKLINNRPNYLTQRFHRPISMESTA
jgi:hypothetical protein